MRGADNKLDAVVEKSEREDAPHQMVRLHQLRLDAMI